MKPFKFKRFTVNQDKCAMKVGTDGVLLGAWTSLDNNPFSILDIGAGTGVISLIMAQRSSAEILDALEIDDDSFEQCTENFEDSPWSDRLFCYHASFQEFAKEMDEPYDLIVSNPPFFIENVSSGDVKRDNARQNQSLPFEHLLNGVNQLLSPSGSFSTIVPYSEEERFIKPASESMLFPIKITRVRGNANSPLKRSLIQFSREEKEPQLSELVIEKERHVYTKEYITLTEDFYLKM